jgi:hypothetical protein
MATNTALTTEDVELAYEPIREYSELKRKEAQLAEQIKEVGGRLRTFFTALGKQAGLVRGIEVIRYVATAGFAEARFRKEEPELAEEFTKRSVVLGCGVESYLDMLNRASAMMGETSQSVNLVAEMRSMVTGAREELDIIGLKLRHPAVADKYVVRTLKVNHSAVDSVAGMMES